ncbi:MAG: Uma2 family endonuclease [Thermoanaerobaculia bacterium]
MEDLPWLDRDEGRAELVAGTLVREPPPGEGHGGIAAQVAALLLPFVREHGLGWVFVETGYVLANDPDTVRGPDVSFVSARRLATASRRGPYRVGAPDLAVEVVSLADSRREVAAKAAEYLAAGAEAVWIIDPRHQTVTTNLPERRPTTLGRDETLHGEPCLPGLRLAVADLFAFEASPER